MLVNMSGGKVEEITEIVTPDLLWTNASPTSEFGEQTINVLGGYSAFLIECAMSTGNTDIRVTNLLSVGDSATITTIGSDKTTQVGRWRTRLFTANASSIVVGVGKRQSATGISNTVEDNDSMIPTRIWGAKYDL